MHYILAIRSEISDIELELFRSKEELLDYLENDKDFDWKLVQTVDLDDLEQLTHTVAEYIASSKDLLGRGAGAYLRVIKD